MYQTISFRGFVFVVAIALFVVDSSFADHGRGAQITRLKGDVHLSGPGSSMIAASANAKLDEGSTVQTGADSWVELRFDNLGCARLGPNSLFSFQNGSRRMTLKGGSALLQIPKGAHGARVDGDQNVAVVAGTTALFESHPNVFKFLVLEGTVRFFRPGHFGDSVLLLPGRMLIGQPGTALSDPVDFDLGRFLKTSRFVTDFEPLESANQMALQAQKQDREKAKGVLHSTNLAIFGSGTSVSVLDPAKSPSPGETPAGSSPPPEKMRDMAAPPVDRIPTGR